MKKNLIFTSAALFILLTVVYIKVHAETKSSNVEWLVEPKFKSGRDFSEGMAVVYQDGRYGYINDKGEIVIEPKFVSAVSFSEGVASVGVNGRDGLINTRGEMIIEPQFSSLGKFSEGLAPVKIDASWGFINLRGEIVIKPQFRNSYGFSEGFARVQKDGKWGLINKEGVYVTEPRGLAVDPRDLGFDDLYGLSFYDDLAMVTKNSKFGFINRDGAVVIQPEYHSASKFSEGLAAVKTYGKVGYINTKGDIVIEQQYSEGGVFSEGLACVVLNNAANKWGYINKKGKLVIDASEFDIVKKDWFENFGFTEGLLPVRKNRLWGYINRKGAIVIEPQFDSAGQFTEGYALVSKDGKSGYIKNPLKSSDKIESFNSGGQLIGVVKSVSDKEIIVGGSSIAQKVFLGDKLCVYSGEHMILLRSAFPMMTVVKCEVITGNRKEIKPGLKVYKYKKRDKDDK